MYIIQFAWSGVVISVYLASPFLRLNVKVEVISEKRFFFRVFPLEILQALVLKACPARPFSRRYTGLMNNLPPQQ